ncbi:MAG: DUF167 domain-containing protein [Thermoplasmata archaeon]
MRINVRVRQGNGLIEELEGTVVVFTNEKRKNNRANIDVIRQLSKHYSVPVSNIRIVSGATSPKKVVEILK